MNKLLIASTALSLVAGSHFAFAQQEHGGRAGAAGIHGGGAAMRNGGGVASQNSPAGINRGQSAEQRGERSSPRQSSAGQIQQDRGHSQTVGQAPRNDRRERTDIANDRNRQTVRRDNERNRITVRENERGRLVEERRGGRGFERDRVNARVGERDRVYDRSYEDRSRVHEGRDRANGRDLQRDRLYGRDYERGRVYEGRGDSRERTTTGQAVAPVRGAIRITPDQRARLHQVFVGERAAPRLSDVDFDLVVGRPVPRSVHFVPVPPPVFAIEPAWRDYDYFMVGDQVVIVDPVSFEIVAILDV